MIKKILIHVFISIIVLAFGFALKLSQNWLIDNFGMLIITIGLIYFFLVPAVTHIKYSKNKIVLIRYLTIFLILNIGRHLIDLYLILYSKEYLDYLFHPPAIYFTGLTIWLLGAIGTTIFIGKMIRSKLSYQSIIAERNFKIIIGYIILILLLELPLYNWHGDFFGQPHGHSFWNYFHLH